MYFKNHQFLRIGIKTIKIGQFNGEYYFLKLITFTLKEENHLKCVQESFLYLAACLEF